MAGASAPAWCAASYIRIATEVRGNDGPAPLPGMASRRHRSLEPRYAQEKRHVHLCLPKAGRGEMDAFLARAGVSSGRDPVRDRCRGRDRIAAAEMPAGKAPMGSGAVSKTVLPRVPLRHGEGSKDHLTSF